jgi:hypothetical protein
LCNPYAFEVTLTLDGAPHVAKLTLGALAELEGALGDGSMIALAERFESGRYSSRDVLALVVAGLRGGGWRGAAGDLMAVDIGYGGADGGAVARGPIAAAQVAALLLARAFAPPPES